MLEGEYIKENTVKDKSEKEKNFELIESIMKTRKALNEAHHNFEFAEDDLIDYYSYQIKANQSKLDYLIRIAKRSNLSLETINNIFIEVNFDKNKAV